MSALSLVPLTCIFQYSNVLNVTFKYLDGIALNRSKGFLDEELMTIFTYLLHEWFLELRKNVGCPTTLSWFYQVALLFVQICNGLCSRTFLATIQFSLMRSAAAHIKFSDYAWNRFELLQSISWATEVSLTRNVCKLSKSTKRQRPVQAFFNRFKTFIAFAKRSCTGTSSAANIDSKTGYVLISARLQLGIFLLLEIDCHFSKLKASPNDEDTIVVYHAKQDSPPPVEPTHLLFIFEYSARSLNTTGTSENLGSLCTCFIENNESCGPQ